METKDKKFKTIIETMESKYKGLPSCCKMCDVYNYGMSPAEYCGNCEGPVNLYFDDEDEEDDFMNPTIYSFPDGYAHGLKKDDFMEWIEKDWIHGDSNYDDFVWYAYEDLGGEYEVNDDCVIIDYDPELYNKAEKIVLQKYLHEDVEWKNDYWQKYLAEYEYPYFIGEDE